ATLTPSLHDALPILRGSDDPRPRPARGEPLVAGLVEGRLVGRGGPSGLPPRHPPRSALVDGHSPPPRHRGSPCGVPRRRGPGRRGRRRGRWLKSARRSSPAPSRGGRFSEPWPALRMLSRVSTTGLSASLRTPERFCAPRRVTTL